MVTKPKRLQKGDTIGVIAPASPPDFEKLEQGIRFIEKLGLHVKIGKHIEKKMGYLAGTDEERLEDFHTMFTDNNVKAVICARGGYGTARFASKIDYELIKKNPKIFWGYSDITFLHTAIHQQTGLVTFHGPMLESDLGTSDVDPLSKHYFQQLFEPQTITYSERISPLEGMVHGMARGQIVGGNLSLLISTLGTPFEIDTRGKLLFIEDVNEIPITIDRMLNQLFMAGKLKDITGFLIGDFHDCLSKTDGSLTLEDVLIHYVLLANKPTLKGFKIGHCSPNISIPLGVWASINTFEKKLHVESGIL
ncbi:LD-carboxypeptidase [Neobacillus sp. PS3-40]|uniref:S66 peptidase family protein n=1 Tax=Neobacillus sp. PS3-40 TaxID=3070679 RepID=UPI0027E1EBF7|nr:LD-carboxypeptidase [Neobacillus sp. PS3-40]WML44116.1 LD-carboxypeptidase [Neobacillus sp. PS3-40]